MCIHTHYTHVYSHLANLPSPARRAQVPSSLSLALLAACSLQVAKELHSQVEQAMPELQGALREVRSTPTPIGDQHIRGARGRLARPSRTSPKRGDGELRRKVATRNLIPGEAKHRVLGIYRGIEPFQGFAGRSDLFEASKGKSTNGFAGYPRPWQVPWG